MRIHEGHELQIRGEFIGRPVITYRKDCDCPEATASGPRTYVRDHRGACGDVVLTVGIAVMVCDSCDRPWRMMA